jgi:hypothetical protein
MLADAVQSLLADKSALQQELSRLTRHNAALQVCAWQWRAHSGLRLRCSRHTVAQLTHTSLCQPRPQELLEYTAAAAAAGPSLTSPSRCSLDGAEEGSGSSAASSPAGEYAGAASGCDEAAAAPVGLVAEGEDTAASGVVDAGCEQQQDEADECSSGSAGACGGR